MNGRRGFLAIVGGTMVSGVAGWSKTAEHPRLLLPARIVQPIADQPAHRPGLSPMQQTARGLVTPGSTLADYPLLSRQETHMHAFITVAGGLPQDLFLDWLEGGLRMVEGCKPGGNIHQAMQIKRAEKGA